MVFSSSINNNSNNQNRKNISAKSASLTARLLVLGDKKVGKSASIVKFTTGRFIQSYSDSTNDWLYRHSLSTDCYERKNYRKESSSSTSSSSTSSPLLSIIGEQTTTPASNSNLTVELLEQKDIQNLNSNNFFATSTNLLEQQQQLNTNNNINNLASRVALDQQMDIELHEKQNMFNKLHWADAYIVVYAINDINTFNKAIKYLNLIANNINSPLDNQNNHYSSSSANSSNSNSPNNINSNNNTFLNNNNNNNYNNFTYASMCAGSGNSGGGAIYNSINNKCNYSYNNTQHYRRRPILLLGNKTDLEKSARQVSSRDGRLLAIRHSSMFAEISIPDTTQKFLEDLFSSLIECLHFNDQSPLTSSNVIDLSPLKQSELNGTKIIRTQLIKWKPSLTDITHSYYPTTVPVWANIVKSQPIIGTSRSSRVKSISANKIAVRQDVSSDLCLTSPLVAVARSTECSNSIVKKGPMRAYEISTINKSNNSTLNQNTNNRYENLKTSFKRASMAIVGVRGLKNGVNNNNATSKNKNSKKTPADEQVTNKVCGVLEQEQINYLDLLSSSSVTNKQSNTNTTSSPANHQNWLKTHMRLYRGNNNSQENNNNLDKLKMTDTTSLSSENSKLKRPLFRYRTRRTTVGLEEIAGFIKKSSSSSTPPIPTLSMTSVSSENDSTTLTIPAYVNQQYINNSSTSSNQSDNNTSRLNSTSSFSSAGSSSERSSSSLSTSEAYYSSMLGTLNIKTSRSNNNSNLKTNYKAKSSIGSLSPCSSNYSSTNTPTSLNDSRTLTRHGSKSTLSRGSTSGGSYDISDDEFSSMTTIKQQISNHQLNPKSSNKNKSESDDTTKNITDSNRLNYNDNNSIKRRYQLVKSVQSTLTNLTKSSNITAQAAKRSFCNTLLKYSSTPTTAVSVKAVTPLVATTEQTIIKPVVEYCK